MCCCVTQTDTICRLHRTTQRDTSASSLFDIHKRRISWKLPAYVELPRAVEDLNSRLEKESSLTMTQIEWYEPAVLRQPCSRRAETHAHTHAATHPAAANIQTKLPLLRQLLTPRISRRASRRGAVLPINPPNNKDPPREKDTEQKTAH